jgi:hypothetical protein
LRIIISKEEKAKIDKYIDFITTTDNPCTVDKFGRCLTYNCDGISCCGCYKQKQYKEQLSKVAIDKEEFIKHTPIKEMIDTQVAMIENRKKIERLQKIDYDFCVILKKIYENIEFE